MEKSNEILLHMDCYLMSMELICNSMHKDFSYLFANSWCFPYDSIGKSLMVSNSFDEYMEKMDFGYLGIKCEKIQSEGNVLNLLKKYIDEYKVLIISTDAIHCPWSRGYKKVSIWHNCALIGYSQEGIWCLDPYLIGNDKFIIPEDLLNEGEFLYYIKTDDAKEISLNILIKDIANKESIINKNIAMMEAYRDDTLQIETAMELFDYPDDIYLCKIIRGLKAISDGRYQLGFLLERLSKKFGYEDEKIREIYSLLFDASSMWQNIHNVIIRLFFDSTRLKKAKGNFVEYMNRILDTEKSVLSEIKSYVK